ncbi:HNH endonuclease signature motif containing protein [Nocardioides sp. L-11A]|uniref:HNH endonuclease signature motif containing protein n=1 Tax=Nocardioides sp. L-11A TaxID=3043848 RepID=UPI00249C98D5|nr:HNH endonuclease signature motif containing protein [Nocardioides sp. L-11A]
MSVATLAPPHSIVGCAAEVRSVPPRAAAGVIAGDGEEAISATDARRLACQATIIPAVLGTTSEVLDLGRRTRLFTRAQRRALRLRDRHCRAEGCTIPATWTEAHHHTPWSHGGSTDLADAISLCNHHHHRIHDRAFTHDRLPNGDIRFHRRT